MCQNWYCNICNDASEVSLLIPKPHPSSMTTYLRHVSTIYANLTALYSIGQSVQVTNHPPVTA